MDQGVTWFSSIPEQTLSRCKKSTLQCMLFMQLSPELTWRFSPKHRRPKTTKMSSYAALLTRSSAHILSYFLCCITTGSPLAITLPSGAALTTQFRPSTVRSAPKFFPVLHSNRQSTCHHLTFWCSPHNTVPPQYSTECAQILPCAA
jgi:hypothetical protein